MLSHVVLTLTAAVALAAVPMGAVAVEHQPDLCLEIAVDAVDAPAWQRLVAETEATIAERSALFPAPQHASGSTPDGSSWRLIVAAGHDDDATPAADGPCLGAGLEWGARFSRAFLEAGADRMLAEAPTTPGIDSRVDITWLPSEDRLTTTLVFAGPLDIPNGTCWIDEILAVDAASGRVRVEAERGVRTSPFAEGACGRFFDHLPDGGAGGQAASLLPTEVATDTGMLRLHATQVAVTDDGVVLGGSIEGDWN